MRRITIVTTGGTIASRIEPMTGTAVAAISADELTASVPSLAETAEIDTHEFALVNSWDVTPAMAADLARLLGRLAAHDPPDGIVVTHGTDTMEETAFALDLLLDPGIPIVLTGAMRAADSPDADGPRNLLAAVGVAASGETRDAGVTVVMNDEIHAARHVTKVHTTALDAFASPSTGPIGTVDADGGVRVLREPSRPDPIDLAVPESAVELVTMVAGIDGRPFLRALEDGARGLVVEGSGSGNLPAACHPALRTVLNRDIPVVLASRCPTGPVTPTYGGDGGGATLLDLGLIAAGDLGGLKARIALMFLLGGGADTDVVRRWFVGVT